MPANLKEYLFIGMKITVPTSWEHVTIKQYCELHALKSLEQDPIDYMVDVVAILCELKYEVACALTLPQLRQIFEQLGFIEQLPTGPVQARLEIDKQLYVAKIDVSKISADQYISFKDFTKNDTVANLHNVMSSLYVPYKKKFNEIPIAEVAEVFYNKMPITVAYPLAVFFCDLLGNSTPLIQDCLRKRAEEKMKEALEMVRNG